MSWCNLTLSVRGRAGQKLFEHLEEHGHLTDVQVRRISGSLFAAAMPPPAAPSSLPSCRRRPTTTDNVHWHTLSLAPANASCLRGISSSVKFKKQMVYVCSLPQAWARSIGRH